MAMMLTAAAAFTRQIRFHTTSRCLLNSLSLSSVPPSKAKVVVCGGGVIGCSVAYHLAEQGATDVLLIEQGRYDDDGCFIAIIYMQKRTASFVSVPS